MEEIKDEWCLWKQGKREFEEGRCMGHWSWLCNIHSTLFPPSNYVWLGLIPSQLQQRGLIDMSLSSNPVPLLQDGQSVHSISLDVVIGHMTWGGPIRVRPPPSPGEGWRERSFFLPLVRWEQKEHSPRDFWKPTYYHGKKSVWGES